MDCLLKRQLNPLKLNWFQISNVRQMEKSSQFQDGTWIKRPLPLWVVTHSQDSKLALRKLTGLFHFKVRFKDLHSKDVISQCFRCQEFGHKANFCKQMIKCNFYAGSHNSRQCSSPVAPPPKCANCAGDHPASSRDCLARRWLQDTLRTLFLLGLYLQFLAIFLPHVLPLPLLVLPYWNFSDCSLLLKWLVSSICL